MMCRKMLLIKKLFAFDEDFLYNEMDRVNEKLGGIGYGRIRISL